MAAAKTQKPLLGILRHPGELQFPVAEEEACIPIFFFFFLAVLGSLWDLSSPTRDQTHVPCTGRVLTTGRPGKSLLSLDLKENMTSEGWSLGATHDTYMSS